MAKAPRDVERILVGVQPTQIFIARLDEIRQRHHLFDLPQRGRRVAQQRGSDVRVVRHERVCPQLVDDAYNIRRSRLHERGNRPGVHDAGGGHDSTRESPIEIEFVIGGTVGIQSRSRRRSSRRFHGSDRDA